jgi:hypothetical protein
VKWTAYLACGPLGVTLRGDVLGLAVDLEHGPEPIVQRADAMAVLLDQGHRGLELACQLVVELRDRQLDDVLGRQVCDPRIDTCG